MNIQRYILATLALFLFSFLYEMAVHGFFLMKLYVQTPVLWRTVEEVTGYWPLGPGIQLVISAWLAFAFSQLYPKGGVKNGLLFGLFFGVFAGLIMGSFFLWMPISRELGLSWLLNGIGEGLGGGLILGSIYRKQ